MTDRIGMRVAILSGDQTIFYGYGIYAGDQPCPMLSNMPNPKLICDNGEEYWGCETWWFPEEEFDAFVSETETGKAWLAKVKEEFKKEVNEHANSNTLKRAN